MVTLRNARTCAHLDRLVLLGDENLRKIFEAHRAVQRQADCIEKRQTRLCVAAYTSRPTLCRLERDGQPLCLGAIDDELYQPPPNTGSLDRWVD